MIDLKRWEQLKAQVSKLRREADMAEGALRQLTARLETEFGCKTLAEAEEKLKRLERESDEANKQFSEALADFEAEWKDKLEGKG